MIQDSNFWVYIQEKWKQVIRKISVPPPTHVHCNIIHDSLGMKTA